MAMSRLFSTMVLSVALVLGQINIVGSNTPTTNFSNDPYLQFQPSFSRSLPVQLLITGIVLTLCATLAIQLIFTWQYHWPLARVNWMLQFTGVCTLLLNIISILCVVLHALSVKSRQWPYMFEYIAIDVPRLGAWSRKETAIWFVMEATTSALASITHIQFLTYLYPSKLEARLVFLLLGPLAVLASIMTLLPITYFSEVAGSRLHRHIATNNSVPVPHNVSANNASDHPHSIGKHRQALDLFDAARNICNLTLSLLFTLSLLIWGFLVNRRSAWRTDGGTAVFGVGALFLALISTGLNFLNVFVHPHFVWLSSLLWSVVLWQSFLGWWWWVGSASGIATRELDMEQRGRKERKRMKRKRRKVAETIGDDHLTSALPAGHLERWRSSVGAAFSRRRTAPPPVANTDIELTTISSGVSDSNQSHISPPSSSPKTHPAWYSSLFASTRGAWRSLRQAHARAARVQAIEQRQIQIQMELGNGRSLGRLPGGVKEERGHDMRRGTSIGASDADAESEIRSRDGDVRRREAQQHKDEEDVSRTNWWWNPLRNWRLRDSTIY